MQVNSAAASALNAVQSSSETDSVRAKFNTTLLKKSLDMQQQQVAQLMAQTEGKGQIVDIRA